MSKNLFQKYYKKLSREGLIKAILNGLSIGAITLFIASFIFWMTNPKLFWIGIVLFVGVTAGASWLLYYKKYKPTTKAIARRVDDLGLEERLLTMLELENDDSYRAMRQREDAQAALSKVDADMLKVIISSATKILVSCVGVIAIGMSTVSTLSSAGVLPSGREMWHDLFGAPPIRYELTYAIDGEGQLIFEDGTIVNTGETHTVTVLEGEDSGEVYAVSAKEWVFIEWSDGFPYPTRTEKSVGKKMTITVVFTQILGSAGNNGAFDIPNDLPPVEGDGKPSSSPNKTPSNTHGGTYEPSNQIIDDKTYYGDEYDAAYDKIQEELAQDGEILEEQKDITAGYLGGIKADADKDEE